MSKWTGKEQTIRLLPTASVERLRDHYLFGASEMPALLGRDIAAVESSWGWLFTVDGEAYETYYRDIEDWEEKTGIAAIKRQQPHLLRWR